MNYFFVLLNNECLLYSFSKSLNSTKNLEIIISLNTLKICSEYIMSVLIEIKSCAKIKKNSTRV